MKTRIWTGIAAATLALVAAATAFLPARDAEAACTGTLVCAGDYSSPSAQGTASNYFGTACAEAEINAQGNGQAGLENSAARRCGSYADACSIDWVRTSCYDSGPLTFVTGYYDFSCLECAPGIPNDPPLPDGPGGS